MTANKFSLLPAQAGSVPLRRVLTSVLIGFCDAHLEEAQVRVGVGSGSLVKEIEEIQCSQ